MIARLVLSLICFTLLAVETICIMVLTIIMVLVFIDTYREGEEE